MDDADGLCDRLIEISEQLCLGGHHKAAYHALTSAFHLAQEIQDYDRLIAIQQAAANQMAYIDANAPESPLASKLVAIEGGVNLYLGLIKLAGVRARLLQHERTRMENPTLWQLYSKE